MTLAELPVETLSFRPEDETLRTEIRSWMKEHDPGAPPEEFEARLRALLRWQQDLHGAGFIGLSWPEKYGGSGLDLRAEAVFSEELAATGMPELINRIGVYMCGPTIMDFGDEGQAERYLRPMLDASESWCQGFSEPEAGSDLAAIRARGRVDGDRIIINGQKVWTSRAHIARRCACLVRTEPGSERHHGLSLVIVDMEDPGVNVVALPQMLGERHFNEVFLDDVEARVEDVIGGLGNGWKAAMQMLSYERGLFVLERQIRLRRALDELADQMIENGRAGDRGVREKLGAISADLELLKAQGYRTLAGQAAGSLPAGSTSIDKLHLSRVEQELFAVAIELLGPETALTYNQWTHDLLEGRSVSIYGGSTEIQLNIISKQLLGLGAKR
ncbi:MAG TPA: acyl-CoA dehydrogenase family protein [Solirubrobacterales bacterium]|nr:acyl-CoA dehydrogenase family protein [Solirubrobacterales bacterium]